MALPQATAAGSPTLAVKVGDRVRVTLRDGAQVEGKAEGVTTDSISVTPSKSGSATQRSMWADVAGLERQKTHVAKTVLAVSLVGVVALVLLVVVTKGDCEGFCPTRQDH